MFRILASFILTSFLFIGILSTADLLLNTDSDNEKTLTVQISKDETVRDSIKEIEKITANNNYSFTSKNSLR
ncbi:MAG: hypothetical protein WAV89_04400 [Ignavibacteriaceae bacterium]